MPRTVHVSLPSVPAIGVFFSGQEFFQHLCDTYNYIDCITYTCQSFRVCPSIRRLIVGISYISKRAELGIKPTLGVRYFTGLHTKLYLGYKRGTICDAFVGSHNLVMPTLEEIVVRTNNEQRDYLAKYFECLWNKK